MSFEIDGPSTGKINNLLKEALDLSEAFAQRVLDGTAAGAVALLSRAYQTKIYQSPLSDFGYPRNLSQNLAQSIQLESSKLRAAVFTQAPHALYVEKGTGLHALEGPKKKITPKAGHKFLAFPVWALPGGEENFKGLFVSAEDAEGSLPAGAIGMVLARSVKGMKPRPVWFDRQVLEDLNEIAQRISRSEDFL